jgi:hypothetical protein
MLCLVNAAVASAESLVNAADVGGRGAVAVAVVLPFLRPGFGTAADVGGAALDVRTFLDHSDVLPTLPSAEYWQTKVFQGQSAEMPHPTLVVLTQMSCVKWAVPGCMVALLQSYS